MTVIVDYLKDLTSKVWGGSKKGDKTISTLTLGTSRFVSLVGRPETPKDNSDRDFSSRNETTISIEGIGVGFPDNLDDEDNRISDKSRVAWSIRHAISQARRMAGRRKTSPDGVSLFLSVYGSAKPPKKPESLKIDFRGSLSVTEENRIYVNQLMDYSLAEEIIHCIRSLGAEVKDVVFEPFGVGKAILTPEEKAKEVAVIDIGKKFTDLAIFKQGYISYANSIPMAGRDIDRAIGKSFEIELWEAEYVKQEVGTLNISSTDIDKELSPIQVHSGTDKCPETIDPLKAAWIIGSEVENIMDMAFSQLGQNGPFPEVIVLTGNISLIEGVVPFVEDHYGVQARKEGVPSGFSGLAHLLDEPRYHSSFGLLRCGLEYEQEIFKTL